MKRWSMLLLALGAVSGCVELDVWLKEKQAAEPSAVTATPARVRIQVNASDVTESNAWDVARALSDELDQAEKR